MIMGGAAGSLWDPRGPVVKPSWGVRWWRLASSKRSRRRIKRSKRSRRSRRSRRRRSRRRSRGS